MKTRCKKIHLGLLNTTALTALISMFIMPVTVLAEEDDDEGDDAEVLALTQPQNYVEFGGIYTSEDSAKFGEYSGLDGDGVLGNSGFDVLGDLSIRGGSAYGGGDGTMRWGLFGTDLGLTSRSVTATASDQGLWDVSIGYDELRHNISDTYRTPQLGGLGSNNFTLPLNFGTIDGNHGGADLPFDANSTRSLSATQLGLFHTEKVHSDRDNISFNGGYIFSKQWNVRLNFNHLEQSGAKLIGTGEQGGHAITGGSTSRAEGNNILMNPTEYTTDTIDLSLNWLGDKAHVNIGYFGSLFNDKYNSLSWQNNLAENVCTGTGAGCYSANTMSTAPDNEFHQFNLTGGYVFSPKTKLAGGFSYGINTQDDNYAPTLVVQPDGTTFNMMRAALPKTSLDGEVHNIHGDLKLTHKATRDLGLSAAFKYNERDNQTASNTYLFKRLGNNSNYTGVNLPYSNRKVQAEVAADYRLSKSQKLHLGYEHEFIERWCDSVVGGAECVASPESDEDKFDITYRVKASETVRLNAGYAFAYRDADFDNSHISNINTPPSGFPGPNSGDDVRYHAYIYDDRTQHKVKGGINWQASNKWDWGLNGHYSNFDYGTGLGRQDSHQASINLDATYILSEDQSFSAYASWQNSEREIQLWEDGHPLADIWSNQLKQDSYAIGLNGKHTGLMDGKLEVLGDMSYSFDTSHYSTQIPYEAATCGLATTLECGSTPDITTSILTFKLNGTYKLNKKGKVRLGYTYQLFDSEDYYYNGLQYGYTPDRVLPTFEQAPGYSEHLVYMSYVYEF